MVHGAAAVQPVSSGSHSAGGAPEPASGPVRSMTDSDWVSRLGSRTPSPEDQNRLPDERAYGGGGGPVQVSPSELEESALMASWMERVRDNARAEQQAARDVERPRLSTSSASGDRSGQAPNPAVTRGYSASESDPRLWQATPQSGSPAEEGERLETGETARMTLVSSVDLSDGNGTENEATPARGEVRSLAALSPNAQARYQLLSHQGAGRAADFFGTRADKPTRPETSAVRKGHRGRADVPTRSVAREKPPRRVASNRPASSGNKVQPERKQGRWPVASTRLAGSGHPARGGGVQPAPMLSLSGERPYASASGPMLAPPVAVPERVPVTDRFAVPPAADQPFVQHSGYAAGAHPPVPPVPAGVRQQSGYPAWSRDAREQDAVRSYGRGNRAMPVMPAGNSMARPPAHWNRPPVRAAVRAQPKPVWPKAKYTADGLLAPPAQPMATTGKASHFQLPPPRSIRAMRNDRSASTVRAGGSFASSRADHADRVRASIRQAGGEQKGNKTHSVNRFERASSLSSNLHEAPRQSPPSSLVTRELPARHASAGGAPVASLETLLSAPAGYVSIQWVAGTDPARLAVLQQRYPLLAQATVVPFFSQGRNWYLLLSGLYPDVETALAQLRRPEHRDMIRELWPWVRPLDSLKKLELSRMPASRKMPAVKVQQAASPAVLERSPLPQGAYAIEWMRAESPSALWMLRRRHPELESAEVAVLTRDGRIEYLLIQGRFAGRPQAVAALAEPGLSRIASELRPRLRAMASLKHRTGDASDEVVMARAGKDSDAPLSHHQDS